jgi:hypothetical protein
MNWYIQPNREFSFEFYIEALQFVVPASSVRDRPAIEDSYRTAMGLGYV